MADFLAVLVTNCAAFGLASWVYVRVLIFVKDRFHGWPRYVVGFGSYVLMSAVIIVSFMYVFQSAATWWATVIGWAISIAPGLYWFSRHEIKL